MSNSPVMLPAMMTLLTVCGAAFGQGETRADPPTQPAAGIPSTQVPGMQLPPPQARLTLAGEHNASSDFSDAPGDVNITRGGAELSIIFTTDERSRIVAAFGAERSWYAFDNATGFVGGSSEPWDNIFSLDAGVMFSRKQNAQWSWFAGGSIGTSGQDGADEGDSMTFGGVVGATYAVNEDLSLGLGVRARTVLEDDMSILPIPMFDWRIDPEWRLATEQVQGGYGVVLSYTANEELTLRLAAAFQGRHFRLDDEAAAPNGVGRDSRIPIFLGMTWRMHPQAELNAQVGVNAAQEFTLDDVDGNRINRLDADIGFFAGLGVTVSF